MATKGFVLYLLSGFSVAILSVLFVSDLSGYNPDHKRPPSPNSALLHSSSYGSSTDAVWPELQFNWRLVVVTLIGFLGSACGTVGGVGGGGIFVPMLTLIVGFDTKSAAALSKCMIMGASVSSVWYNIRVPHPTKEVPILDYDLALLFQPMLMLGITIGVALSVVFPYWLITVLIIILFMGTSSRSFFKGLEMWKEETIMKKEMVNQQETVVNSRGERKTAHTEQKPKYFLLFHELFVNGFKSNLIFFIIICKFSVLIDTQYEPLIPREEKSPMQLLCFNLRWKMISVLLLVWVAFLALQIIKNDVEVCSAWYWVLFCLQFPIALGVFGYESVKLYKEQKKRMSTGNRESICEASIEWTAVHIAFCSLCGILGGTVGGLLGSGGGFILGPLLLEIGVIPQVASATATFVMMFSSSLSVVEFYLLKRFPIPYAVYLTLVSVCAGFWGQFLIRKMITILRRASLIVFILSGVIFASALTMGVIGIETSVEMIRNHEFMGFLGFCSSQ